MISGIFSAYFMCSHSVVWSSSHHAVGVSPPPLEVDVGSPLVRNPHDALMNVEVEVFEAEVRIIHQVTVYYQHPRPDLNKRSPP